MGLDSTSPEHIRRSVAASTEREKYLLHLARRRAAQHDWHVARAHVEGAIKALRDAGSRVSPRVVDARLTLEKAQRGERKARSIYRRVARDTSTQLSRLGTRATDRSR